MQKSLHTLTDRAVYSEVEDSAYDFKANNEYGVLWYMIPPLRGYTSVELPEGQWTLLCTDARQIKEEEAKRVVEKYPDDGVTGTIYMDYDHCIGYYTALESFRSLEKHLNLDPNKRRVILVKL